jgi:hypothetical protein
MQHLKSQTNIELDALKATKGNLEKKVHTVQQQRDIWEGDTKFVKEQLKE